MLKVKEGMLLKWKVCFEGVEKEKGSHFVEENSGRGRAVQGKEKKEGVALLRRWGKKREMLLEDGSEREVSLKGWG